MGQQTVLVTGSSGLIGSEAVLRFERRGRRVLGIDNNMRRIVGDRERSVAHSSEPGNGGNTEGILVNVESSFMYRTIKHLVARDIMSPLDSVLVVCGGSFDEAVLGLLNFEHVLYTNIDPGQLSAEKAVAQDVRNLGFPDSSFDCAIVHGGIHHVDRPHQAVCEMYRVARKTILVMESQDSFLMRLAVRFGPLSSYEMNAPLRETGLRGGVNDTPIPNYVFRWTRREVEKMIRCVDPIREPSILFFTEWDFYWPRIARRVSRSPLRIFPEKALSFLASVGVRTINLLARGQGNLLAICIRKNAACLQPWIVNESGALVFRNPEMQ